MEDTNHTKAVAEAQNNLESTKNCKQHKYRKVDLTRSFPVYVTEDIQRIRAMLKLSQRSFAKVLGVSHKTVESWESGHAIPNGSTQRLLYLLDTNPSLVENLII